MMRRQNNRFRRFTINREVSCGCGGTAKLSSRKNYPYGKKSKPIRTTFYKCKKCSKITMLNKDHNGGRR